MKRPVVFSLFREQSVFMTVIVGIMTFLAVLALGISLSIGTAVNRWNRQWDSFVTLQVTNTDKIATVKKIIESSKTQIAYVHELNTEEMEKLMRPWISGGNDVLQKYMPKMFEIKFKTKSNIAPFTEKIGSNARVLTHVQALNPSISAGWKTVAISTLVLILILGAIGICISFIARNIAVLHKRELEILNQVGATDNFVAHQMQIIVTKICLVACGIGFIVALPILLAIFATAQSTRVGLMAMMGMGTGGWIATMLLPVAIIIFAIFITKHTTLKILKNN